MVVNATTLARVKAHSGDTATGNDALLTTLIDQVSRDIEKFLGYELEQKSRVEIRSPDVNQRIVHLRHRPVVSVTQVRVAAEGSWNFAAFQVLTANADYRLSGDSIYFFGGLIWGRDTLEITYTAGLGANDAAVIAAAPEVALAAELQTNEEFRRRTNPNTLSRPGPGGTKTYAAPHGMLPRVRELLFSRRRMAMAEGRLGAVR